MTAVVWLIILAWFIYAVWVRLEAVRARIDEYKEWMKATEQ